LRAEFGDDPRRYEFNEGLDELSATVQHAVDDGLTKRQLDPAEPFHPKHVDVNGSV